MDDVGIVAAMRAGDSNGLAAAYDSYADRLFTYCVTLLRDRDRAADIVHDTFIVAYQRIGQLRDPTRLRPWLYAIARNECLRSARLQARSVPLEEAGPMSDDRVDLGVGLREQELRQLVWTAADGLNPREREVVELSVRHGLEGSELASALGVPANHAHALLSKARQQLERALAALIVARTGRTTCTELDGLLTGWDGGMSVLLRKRVARHIDSCASCGERRRTDVSAAALLGSMPLLAIPAGVRDRLFGGLGNLDLVSTHTAIARRAGRFDGSGFPIPHGRGPLGRAWQGPAVAAMAAIVLLVGGLTVSLGADEQTAAQAAIPTQTLDPSQLPSLSPGPTEGESPTPTTKSPTTKPTTRIPTTTTPPPDPPSEDPPDPPDPPVLLIVNPIDVDLDDQPTATVVVSSESESTIEFITKLTWMYHPGTPVSWLLVNPPIGLVDADTSVPVVISLGSTPEPAGQWTVKVAFRVVGSDYTETVTVTGCGSSCDPPDRFAT
ncbi:MAG: RNA polymerase sigma factor [Sporichthyaceae bacterium]|nr:RNA polymerase sigma factor [Sporichthyaceae bacterium]